MTGTYSDQDLQELSSDEEFGQEVREFTRALFAAGVVRNTRDVTPLLQYGPGTPGVVLRLVHLHKFADLDGAPELQARWASLLGRFEAAVTCGTRASSVS